MIDFSRPSRPRAALAALILAAALAAAATARAQAPAAPIPAYPSDLAQNITVYATLKWKKTSGAATYHVQLDTTAGFAAPLVQDSAVADTSLKMTRLADSTKYWWRVRAANASGFGPWSKLRAFTTTPPLVAGPVLVAPEYFATGVAKSPTLIWNAFPEAKGYTLQVSLTGNFDSLLFTKTDVMDTTWKLSGLDMDVTYYWHVRANTSPVYTAWTKGAFTTGLPAALGRARSGSGPAVGLQDRWRVDGRAMPPTGLSLPHRSAPPP